MRDQDAEFFPELLQIMSSVLDDLYLKIMHLPKLKDYYYEDFFTSRALTKQIEVLKFRNEKLHKHNEKLNEEIRSLRSQLHVKGN